MWQFLGRWWFPFKLFHPGSLRNKYLVYFVVKEEGNIREAVKHDMKNVRFFVCWVEIFFILLFKKSHAGRSIHVKKINLVLPYLNYLWNYISSYAKLFVDDSSLFFLVHDINTSTKELYDGFKKMFVLFSIKWVSI